MQVFVVTVLLGLVMVFFAARADAHRLSGHPKSLQGRLTLAKKQVAHDHRSLKALSSQGWTFVSPIVAFSHRWWLARDRAYVKQLERLVRPDVLAIICQVFGPYCGQAQRVALCEGGRPVPSVNARNGQYLGIFQMGSFARSMYGHGRDAWSQARAAYRYFVASGRDWSPWTCKP